MPFKSEKQRKWMWANDPEMAEKWEKEEDEKNEGNIMRITRRQLKRIIREEKRKILREAIDPEYMKEEILGLAETIDAGGMSILLDIVGGARTDDLDAAFDTIERLVMVAPTEKLAWIHQEITNEGLFG